MDGAGHRASAGGPGAPGGAPPGGGGGGGGEEDTMRLYAVFQNSFNKIASTPGGGPDPAAAAAADPSLGNPQFGGVQQQGGDSIELFWLNFWLDKPF